MRQIHASATARNMPDLFSYTVENYPHQYPRFPGHKGLSTSLEAARKVAPKAGTARAIVLDAFKSAYPRGLTPDEAAAIVQRPPLWIRPRVTELRQQGLIEATAQKRTNPDSGCEVFVLRATRKAMEAA